MIFGLIVESGTHLLRCSFSLSSWYCFCAMVVYLPRVPFGPVLCTVLWTVAIGPCFCLRKKPKGKCGCSPGVKERWFHYGYRTILYDIITMFGTYSLRLEMNVVRLSGDPTTDGLCRAYPRLCSSHDCHRNEIATMMDCVMFPWFHLFICLG